MSISHCYNLKLRQASRVLTSHYDAYLRDDGLTVTQFSILRSLWYLKSTSQKDLQEVLVLQQTTLTRNLKPLLRDGYIQITPSAADGRIKLVSLTDTGKTLFQSSRKKWKKAQESLSNQLGSQLSEQLISVADAIIALD
ncbi:MarR family winged helix-turn-helix transcriptional regulator [Oceaniserpentilla sp. 4NH20-0058]|uniref:MarR family winged helix-turn-helix transcriptional regulator n=1 Tax=Oceaniserpentilla sp. 4NH20-0058 TaxID=3127660 RepID=UPI00310C0F3F